MPVEESRNDPKQALHWRELHTERLVLREFRPDDAAAVHAYWTQPAYLAPDERTAPAFAEAAAFVDLMIQWRDAVPRTRYQLVVTLAGHLIGTVGVRQTTPGARTAEYGCELAPAAWGQGYAREASEAILAFGTRELGLTRFVAQTRPGNQAALRLARSLGFRCAADGRCTRTSGSHRTVVVRVATSWVQDPTKTKEALGSPSQASASEEQSQRPPSRLGRTGG